MAAIMLEAGLNWCVGNFADQFIVIHSATLERNGRALLMPAPPGSGKSTLCAALVAGGWRLLSDEFALIDPVTGFLVPVTEAGGAQGTLDRSDSRVGSRCVLQSVVNNEGQTVAYMRPPTASVQASANRCAAGLIVIPQYAQGAEATVSDLTQARTVLHLADNSFNYNLHGRQGFERLADIADAAPCVTLRYSDLPSGTDIVNRLSDQVTG